MNRKPIHNPAVLNSTKRRRGGQFGNRNAFKHGFYSDQFKLAERMNLSWIKNTDLTNEIEVVRVELRRYLEAETVALNQIDYETRLQALRTVSFAAESLTRLIRTQVILNTKSLELKNDQETIPPTDANVD